MGTQYLLYRTISIVVDEQYLGLIHVSCVTSHLSSSQRVQLRIGII